MNAVLVCLENFLNSSLNYKYNLKLYLPVHLTYSLEFFLYQNNQNLLYQNHQEKYLYYQQYSNSSNPVKSFLDIINYPYLISFQVPWYFSNNSSYFIKKTCLVLPNFFLYELTFGRNIHTGLIFYSLYNQ